MSVKQILVPLDGSDIAEGALPIARLIAKSVGATITLIGVSTEGEPAWTRELYTYLENIASAERQSGFRVQTALRTGDPGDAILILERELDVDLVVMATHGRRGVGRVLLGSVADKVSQASVTPVVLVHAPDRPIEHLRTILVAVDGTPGGAVALATAVPLARQSGARIVLVRASIPLPLWVRDPNLGLDTFALIDPMWDEDARAAAEAHAEGLAASLRRVGVPAEGRGVSGEPAPVIVSVATEVDADLIVMSTHGRHGAARSVLGSVSDEVVRRSRRPVLLVRRGLPHAKPSVNPRQRLAGVTSATL